MATQQFLLTGGVKEYFYSTFNWLRRGKWLTNGFNVRFFLMISFPIADSSSQGLNSSTVILKYTQDQCYYSHLDGMFQTLRSNAVVELFLPLQNPVGHHFLTTEQLEQNHSPALCFIITDSGSCRAVQAADCKNAYYRAQQCFCALEWCITAVTSIPTVRVWNPVWEIVVSKRMLHHSQYSSAVQGLHMCEDLRCNLQLKQMTVWTDEADPRSDLLNTAQHQKHSSYSSIIHCTISGYEGYENYLQICESSKINK